MKNVVEVAGRRKSVMDRLGIAATILEGAMNVVGVVEDVCNDHCDCLYFVFTTTKLHPAIKITLGSVRAVYNVSRRNPNFHSPILIHS
jgi:hypothetical protein